MHKHPILLSVILLFALLLQGQSQPLTGVIEKIQSTQKIQTDSGEITGRTVLTLQTVNAIPAILRVYFPSNRSLERVSLESRPLRFTHQGGLLTVFLDTQISAVSNSQSQPLQLVLTYRSKQEALNSSSGELFFDDYQLSYELQTTTGIFEAQTQFKLTNKAPPRPIALQSTAKNRLKLTLNRNFTVQAVQIGGSKLPFRHSQGQLQIDLPGPLTTGRSYSLSIRYSGKLPGSNKYQVWDTPFGGGPYYYPAHPLKPGAY
jgi:hypothetical protein